jgi:hypothetical protein
MSHSPSSSSEASDDQGNLTTTLGPDGLPLPASRDEKKGRRKINIEFIEDKSRRHITFSKRKAGIMKKAYELSTLTGTQVLLLVASETGHVYTFATPKLQPLITKPEGKNLIQSCLNAPDPAPGSSAAAAGPAQGKMSASSSSASSNAGGVNAVSNVALPSSVSAASNVAASNAAAAAAAAQAQAQAEDDAMMHQMGLPLGMRPIKTEYGVVPPPQAFGMPQGMPQGMGMGMPMGMQMPPAMYPFMQNQMQQAMQHPYGMPRGPMSFPEGLFWAQQAAAQQSQAAQQQGQGQMQQGPGQGQNKD